MRFVQEATIVAVIAWSCVSATSAQMPMLRLPSTAPPAVPASHGNFRFTRLPPITQSIVAQPLAVDERLASVTAWWEHHVGDSQRPGAASVSVSANELIAQALAQSEHVMAVSQGPLIQQENVLRAIAEFDPAIFFESRWDDLSNPVGNTLTTGGPSRFSDHHWQNRGGMRQKTTLGGTIELSQAIGLQDTNSIFFIPGQQAQTRTTLGLNQPLLRRAGRQYNESAILLAEVATNIAEYDLSRELQDHAYGVIQAYWDLYMQRALYLQRHRSHEQAVRILTELQSREQIDSLRSQISRARAAVAIRRAGVQRALLATQTAQSRIVTLTNNQFWRNGEAVELMPVEAPATTRAAVDLHNAFQTALHYRPEVAKHMEEIREAQIRLGISENELLPTLDLVLETYVAGLDGDNDVSDALGSQFARGAPSYSAGIIFEVPLGNRAAQAEYRRRQAQVDQLMHELKAVLSQVSLEVEVAVAEVEATYQELLGRYEAMLATDEELKYLFDRWRLLPGDDRAVSFVLEELLDAQDRQTEAEAAYVRAQVAYTLANFNLQRASGALLHFGQPMSFADAGEPTPVPAGAIPFNGPAP
ncbi:MAG: TolC family protein [Planctomycetaceae bacterium]|nr:TolC family protein [Planctomycetales bacterium]MCB9873706.1 TolC family protein [Planctomycetaceae bacterium]MCB9938159.1 TolC family protein [Planctomycetaceae bacterium]